MKKVYFASRIPEHPETFTVLEIDEKVSVDEIGRKYGDKIIDRGSYIHNGPWILRAPSGDGDFLNKLPEELTTAQVWNMVKEKIESSDVVIGLVNTKSFGTIAELGYACKCPRVAVYVLPDLDVTPEQLSDLWFIFNMSVETQDRWNDEDIRLISKFAECDIHSVSDYEEFISGIIPNFMR